MSSCAHQPGGPLSGPRRQVALHYVPNHGRFGDPKPIVHEGRVHVFFQNSPRPDAFASMRWAHVVSDDLLRWTVLPEALTPGQDGPDAHGCWTGCVLRHDGRFHAYYTGVGGTDGTHQTVCRAESDDLIHWRKDPANPLVVPAAPFAAGPEAAWRDPQIRSLPDGTFEMVLTAELDHGPKALRACVARLVSSDLRAWRIDGVLYHPADVHRCECPEVVEVDGRHALIYSDYGVQVRVADDPLGPYHRPAASQLDDFRWYAAKTALDGSRRLVFGFVFDRIAAAAADPDDGSPWTWGGTMAFPRELTSGPDGAPALRAAAELTRLRAAPLEFDPDFERALGAWTVTRHDEAAEVRGDAAPDGALGLLRLGPQPQQCELLAQVRWGSNGRVGLLLYADAEVASGYRLDLDRGRGDVTLRRLIPYRNPASPVLQRMALPLDLPEEIELRALLDGSVLELFLGQRVVFTARLYERPGDAWWGVFAPGPIHLARLQGWRLALPPGEPDDACD